MTHDIRQRLQDSKLPNFKTSKLQNLELQNFTCPWRRSLRDSLRPEQVYIAGFLPL
jgi:hypothetical protein